MTVTFEDPAISLSGSSCILSCSNVSKRYGDRAILDGFSFDAHAGTLKCIVGPSGCGKSTLLNILGGLDTAYEGAVAACGLSLHQASSAQLDQYRSRDVGFVFQDFNLIDHLTVLENVSVALQVDGLSRDESKQTARRALDRVGLGHRLSNCPNQLSGGEAQRVAIARAVAKQPSIVLADEPTGSLDERSAEEVVRQLKRLAEGGACVVVVTHDVRLFEPVCDEVIELDPLPETENAVGEPVDLGDKTSETFIPCENTIGEEPLGSTSTNGTQGMSFKALLMLVLLHMRARKRRVVGASIACAVGMIGLGLMFALMFGAFDYAQDLQSRLLTNTPITITCDISMSADTTTSLDEARQNQELVADGSLDGVIEQVLLSENGDTMQAISIILREMQREDASILSVQEVYPLTNDVYVQTEDGWRFIDRYTLYEDVKTSAGGSSVLASTIMEKMPDANSILRTLISDDPCVLDEKYELLGGRMPSSANEVVIVTRPDGSIGDVLLALLGCLDTDALVKAINSKEEEFSSDPGLSQGEAASEESKDYARPLSFDQLLSLKLAVLQACDYRVQEGNGWTNAWYERALLDDAIVQGTELQIVGIVAPRYAVDGVYDAGYIGYMPSLTSELVDHANNSPAVLAQKANPDRNIETGALIAQERDLAERILSKLDVSGLDDRKLAYLRSLSNVRVLALLRSAGIDEEDALAGKAAELDDFLVDARSASYEDLVASLESIAPLSLDEGVGAMLGQLDAYGPERIQEVRVYVDSLDEWQCVVDKVDEFNEVRVQNQLSTVSVSYAPEITLFEQAIQIAALVMFAFVLLSVLIILVTVGSTMGTFVAERTREIGCLRSLGMSKRSVGSLFVIEAIAIGVIAVLFASLVLVVVVALLNGQAQEIMGSADLFRFDALTVAVMLLASTMLCVVAGSIPARAASRKDPIAALRLTSD